MNNNMLLPFSHNESRPHDELALSTQPRPQGQKREYPTSDSLDDGGHGLALLPSSDSRQDGSSAIHSKRFHQFTSEADDNLWTLPSSSPPIGPCEPSSEAELASLYHSGNPWELPKPEIRDYVPFPSSGAMTLVGESSNKELSSNSMERAVRKIQAAIEEAESKLELDSLQLTEVPEELKDLKDLVVITDNDSLMPKIQLYLSNNLISTLFPGLFQVSNITVLSLRNNRLTEIPCAISQLVNLVDFSVGGNLIEYLPCQLMDIKSLQVMSIHPNPFLSPGENANSMPRIPGQHAPFRYASQFQMHDFRPTKHGISLLDLCLVSVAKYSATVKERLQWDIPSNIHVLIEEAVHAVDEAMACGICKRSLALGAGHAFEWWDGVKGTRGLVLRRLFCSNSCYIEWKQSLTVPSMLTDH